MKVLTLLSLISLVFGAGATFGSQYRCTKKTEVRKSYAHDENLTIFFENGLWNIVGSNLVLCQARVYFSDFSIARNANQGHIAAFNKISDSSPGARRCSIFDLVLDWTGNATQIETKAEVKITSYDRWVTYGEAKYTCIQQH